MQLLLESNGIFGFVDGSHPCPMSPADYGTNASSSSNDDCDDLLVWKLHDRAIMQLITATLSPIAMSCAIGSSSSKELWIRLKEQFSSISKTSIFQLKSNLQNIKKGTDSISQYLLRIKEARDYLSAAGVYFCDEDIVILALNGLPGEYNTFRCVVRGRESVITLKDFRSQLLAEESIIENSMMNNSTFLAAMNTTSKHPASQFDHSSRGQPNFHTYESGGYRPFNRNRSRGRFNQGQRVFSQRTNIPVRTNNVPIASPPGVFSSLSVSPFNSGAGSNIIICQLCNLAGHAAPVCNLRNYEQPKCRLCGKDNHTTWFCYYNDSGPNFNGHVSAAASLSSSNQHQAMYSVQSPYSPASSSTQHQAMYSVQSPYSPASSSNQQHAMYSVQTPFPSMQQQSSQEMSPVWITDSGATNHMTPDLSNLSLSSPSPAADSVKTANGEGLSVSHIGNAIIPTTAQPLKLNSVLCVPKLSQNLLSVHQVCLDNNCRVIFDAFCFCIQDIATGRILYKGLCSNGLYPFPSNPSQFAPSALGFQAYSGQSILPSTWHYRLGHPTNKIVKLMLNKACIPCSLDNFSNICVSCLQGKICKQPFHSSTHLSSTPFDIIHSDLWGPSPSISIDGYRFYVIFVDDYSRFCWLFPLINKSDVCSIFIAFYNLVRTQFSHSIKILQSDGGGEYVNKSLHNFLAEKGIIHRKSCPYTPEQNGLAERKHRHLIETTITLLQHAKIPSTFWTYAVHTATYLINRMPSVVLSHKSPFELLFGKIPSISHLRVFGCACFPLLRPYIQHKLQPKTTMCVFLGYASNYKGYICYDVTKKRSYISRHVVFNEIVFPYSELVTHTHHSQSSSMSSSCNLPCLPVVTPTNIVVHPPPTDLSPVNPNTMSSSSSSSMPVAAPPLSSFSSVPISPASSKGMHSAPFSSDDEFNAEAIPAMLQAINIHPMQTRSKNGVFKKKFCLTAAIDVSLIEPSSYKVAMQSSVWLAAMQEELDALHSQGTWSLVSMPHHKNLVGCRWIFKIKRHADGSIARHKARLVAQGFSQEHGQDYGETFSPVVKPTSVRLVLALAAHYGWKLRQLDVKNAFLHGILHEEVYMAQPPGFADSHHSQLVCRLHKSIYGLKQAPRAWNERFTAFLPSLGFQHTYSDASLFVNHSADGIIVLLVYVDDIIITGSNTDAITRIIQSLAIEFEIKDLGDLHFFLGIQIQHVHNGLFLTQSQYVLELLVKTNMNDAKACDTPCLPYQRLPKDDGIPFEDPTLYRSVVGALLYLTFTRPDIAFSVNQVCQFMQQPMAIHFTAVKRILRYLKGTAKYGIHYLHSSLELKAFSDADWAGDPNDRRSTTGLVVFLGSNPISWCSKKQTTVSRSSTEAEYRALSFTAAEIDWIKQLLTFLHVELPQPPVLFCDNLSAIALSFNPVQHQKTKHIEIDVHFVRERVAANQLFVQFVSSTEQFADILTKGLSSPLFRIHCNNLMLGLPHHELEGG